MHPTGSLLRLPHPRERGGRSRGAFSVIEVVVATAILALVISTSLSVMSQGFRAMDTARSVRVATQIIQDEMENIRMANWQTVQSWPVGEPGITLVLDSAYTANAYIGNRFTCRRVVENVSGKTTMRLITLIVTWTGSDGRQHIRSAKTYYTRGGLFSYVSN